MCSPMQKPRWSVSQDAGGTRLCAVELRPVLGLDSECASAASCLACDSNTLLQMARDTPQSQRLHEVVQTGLIASSA